MRHNSHAFQVATDQSEIGVSDSELLHLIRDFNEGYKRFQAKLKKRGLDCESGFRVGRMKGKKIE